MSNKRFTLKQREQLNAIPKFRSVDDPSQEYANLNTNSLLPTKNEPKSANKQKFVKSVVEKITNSKSSTVQNGYVRTYLKKDNNNNNNISNNIFTGNPYVPSIKYTVLYTIRQDEVTIDNVYANFGLVPEKEINERTELNINRGVTSNDALTKKELIEIIKEKVDTSKKNVIKHRRMVHTYLSNNDAQFFESKLNGKSFDKDQKYWVQLAHHDDATGNDTDIYSISTDTGERNEALHLLNPTVATHYALPPMNKGQTVATAMTKNDLLSMAKNDKKTGYLTVRRMEKNENTGHFYNAKKHRNRKNNLTERGLTTSNNKFGENTYDRRGKSLKGRKITPTYHSPKSKTGIALPETSYNNNGGDRFKKDAKRHSYNNRGNPISMGGGNKRRSSKRRSAKRRSTKRRQTPKRSKSSRRQRSRR